MAISSHLIFFLPACLLLASADGKLKERDSYKLRCSMCPHLSPNCILPVVKAHEANKKNLQQRSKKKTFAFWHWSRENCLVSTFHWRIMHLSVSLDNRKCGTGESATMLSPNLIPPTPGSAEWHNTYTSFLVLFFLLHLRPGWKIHLGGGHGTDTVLGGKHKSCFNYNDPNAHTQQPANGFQ